MVSSCTAGEGDPRRLDVHDAILDAAAELVLTLGPQHVQLAQVARGAGVSRQTVYRRFSDVHAVIGSLMTREILRIVAEHVPPRPGLQWLVSTIVGVADGVRHNPVLDVLVSTDPFVATEYLVNRLGTSQLSMLDELTTAIRAAQTDGSVRPGDPGAIAAMVLVLTQATVQSHRTIAGLLAGPELNRELTRALEGYLKP